MKPVQYIIADHTLRMPPGKLAAQVAHASVEGVRLSAREPGANPWDASLVNRWYRAGHYAKIVLESDDLAVAERYLNDRGFKTALIIDEGRTVFEGGLTPTAIGCEVVNKDWPHTAETFSIFHLYGATAQAEEEEQRRKMRAERQFPAEWDDPGKTLNEADYTPVAADETELLYPQRPKRPHWKLPRL